MSIHPHIHSQLCLERVQSQFSLFLILCMSNINIIMTRVATVPVPPGGAARRRRSSAGLHQRRAAAPGAEGRGNPSGAGGGHQTGAATHSPPGPAGLPGLPAPLHANSQVSHLQPSRWRQQPLTSVTAVCPVWLRYQRYCHCNYQRRVWKDTQETEGQIKGSELDTVVI